VERFDANHAYTTDGGAHDVDIVVLATGFESSKMLSPMEIVGRSGVPLSKKWGEDNPYAYLDMTVPDFPNFFIVGGSNTALGHGGSAIYPAECCIAYIAQMLVRMVEDDLSAVEVRTDVCQSYNERVDAERAQLIWTHPGMTVWYKNKHGRVTASTPWRGVDFWEMTKAPDLEDFVITPAEEVTPVT
jgi:4-hydroxyacetophenone monooxygenase